ncbi:MAG TPA: pyridoxamine 5'-phosphate oxidase family protein [Dongiaceae bacterium]|nr:pyridoxamine 5'-phosphate oxidase family protein [Dongiaceae bacterium]
MSRAFSDITLTEPVKSAQRLYGSREANQGFEQAADPRNELTVREAEFIHARDSFYMASVGENGWPYIQHRGGPPGFLKVLDARTIGFADFRGNRQYISAGNLMGDERVMLFLMDYAHRRRLKLWGRARILHDNEAPDFLSQQLLAQLEDPEYHAQVERGILIQVEAWDWNCPQHITPRYTEAEFELLMGRK